jgi:gamma-glutamylcyclotransferase (GGCT)/AIG2-like uncharacterized protein YtfP
MSCPNLFVYGTLLSEFANPYARRLRKQAVLLGPARMRGRLYNLGAYPGMKRSLEPADWVRGELYRLDQPLKLLGFLDAYEVCDPRDGAFREFERITAAAHLVRGRCMAAWVYLYGRPVDRAWRVAGGDYVAFTRGAGLRVGASNDEPEPLK